MRGWSLVVLVVLAGCDKKPVTPPANETPPAPAPGAAPEPAYTVYYDDLELACHAIASHAEARYKGRRGTIDIEKVVDIGRDASGLPQIAAAGFNPSAAPTAYFHFAADQDAEVARLHKGGSVRVEGTLTGQTPDGIDRGAPGYEWHLDFVDCKVIGPAPKRNVATGPGRK